MQFKYLVNRKILDFRAILRIVESAEFAECIALYPNDLNLQRDIETGNVDGVKKWLQRKLKAEITDYSARQLRSLAASLGIPNYCTKHKTALLKEILKVQRAQKIKALTELMPLVETDPNAFLE